MRNSLKKVMAALVLFLIAGAVFAFQPERVECIAPANPGGGYDLTCRLSQTLHEAGLVPNPVRIEYMPGGIGAVAYNHVITRRRGDPNVIIAASTGALVNLAQGKFGTFDENEVRWTAAIAADYGAIVVKADSPYETLDDLVEVLQEAPQNVRTGAGGTVGSQDYMKIALLAQEAGVPLDQLRYASFEGGGETLSALLGGHIDVAPIDVSEAREHLRAGNVRLLAVLSDERLPEPFNEIPTAREQGYDVEWVIWRGYYAPPGIDEAAYETWVETLRQLTETEEFAEQRESLGLFPYWRGGEDFEAWVQQQTASYRELAREIGLIE